MLQTQIICGGGGGGGAWLWCLVVVIEFKGLSPSLCPVVLGMGYRDS